jgi:methyl-accepting chemotaxis protein
MKTSIRRRLQVGFGAVIGLMALVALVAIAATLSLHHEATEAVHFGARLNSIGLEIRLHNLEAQEQEKDFLLEIKAQGVAAAEKDHAARVTAAVEKLSRSSDQGAALARDPFVKQTFSEIHLNADIVLREFRSMLRATERKGHVDTGAEGEFRTAVHAIEDRIKENGRSMNVDKLEIAMLTLRRGEKDYLLRGNVEYIHATEDHVKALKQTISISSLPPGERAQMLGLADRYAESFGILVAADREMESRIDAYRQAAQTLQNAAAEASRAGLDASEASMASLDSMGTISIVLAILISLGALAAGISFSRRIAAGIVEPVRELTAMAETVSLGDLNVRVIRTVDDEIGDLQDSLARLVTALRFYQLLGAEKEMMQEEVL